MAKKITPKTQKKRTADNSDSDFGKYSINGSTEQYLKGPLVRTVMEDFCKKNPWITYKVLKAIIPGSLFKTPYSLFLPVDRAKITTKLHFDRKKYFASKQETIRLKDSTIAVCNQFTLENIQPLLHHFKDLGYIIIRVSDKNK